MESRSADAFRVSYGYTDLNYVLRDAKKIHIQAEGDVLDSECVGQGAYSTEGLTPGVMSASTESVKQDIK